MFAALSPPTTAVDRCTEAIRRAVLDGRLPPGERLPPERRLAEDFGVNRVTVRAALARLSAAGLVSVRQGSGYRVLDFRRHGGPDLLASFLDLAGEQGALKGAVEDLLLVRRRLAAALLERLEGSCSSDDLAALEVAVQRFESAVDDGASSPILAELDVEIVATLLAASGSPVLSLCLNPIVGILQSLPALRDAIYSDPKANVLGWQGLLSWLRDPGLVPLDAVLEGLAERDAATLAQLTQP